MYYNNLAPATASTASIDCNTITIDSIATHEAPALPLAEAGSPVLFGADPDTPLFVDPEYWYEGAPTPPPGYRPPWDNPEHPDYPLYLRSSRPEPTPKEEIGLPASTARPALTPPIAEDAASQRERRERSLYHLERKIRRAPWYGQEPSLAVEYDDGFWLTHGPLAHLIARILANAPGGTLVTDADMHLIDEMLITGFPITVLNVGVVEGQASFIARLIRPASAAVQHGLDRVLGSRAPAMGDVQ